MRNRLDRGSHVSVEKENVIMVCFCVFLCGVRGKDERAIVLAPDLGCNRYWCCVTVAGLVLGIYGAFRPSRIATRCSVSSLASG
jgi:hypothetical protein